MNGEQTKPASVVFPDDLLAEIDARAKELDLNRSQYLRQLARQDLERAKRDKKEPMLPLAHDNHQQAA